MFVHYPSVWAPALKQMNCQHSRAQRILQKQLFPSSHGYSTERFVFCDWLLPAGWLGSSWDIQVWLIQILAWTVQPAAAGNGSTWEAPCLYYVFFLKSFFIYAIAYLHAFQYNHSRNLFCKLKARLHFYTSAFLPWYILITSVFQL